MMHNCAMISPYLMLTQAESPRYVTLTALSVGVTGYPGVAISERAQSWPVLPVLCSAVCLPALLSSDAVIAGHAY